MLGFMFWLIWFVGLICVSVFMAVIITASEILEPIKNIFAAIGEWLLKYPFRPIVDLMERRD